MNGESHQAATEESMDKELLITLMGWAAQLSGYAVPEELPEISFRDHAFFVDKVCAGRECRAVGWYNDEGVVYIDERFRTPDSPNVASLYVHEFVHYLQHRSGRFDSHDCDDASRRERDALAVQNDYLLQFSAGVARFWHVDGLTCRYEVAAGTEAAPRRE
jgi:hypothetical protein